MWALPSSLLDNPALNLHEKIIKLLAINRFCKAVVASGFQAPVSHLIIHGGKSRDGLQETQLAKPPGCFKTIHQGHVHAHQNQVNRSRPLRVQFESRLTMLGENHFATQPLQNV